MSGCEKKKKKKKKKNKNKKRKNRNKNKNKNKKKEQGKKEWERKMMKISLKAVEISREFWWSTSKSRRNKQYQRLFEVKFSDGSVEKLLAEQAGQGRKRQGFLFFEESPFHSGILRE